MTKTKTLQEEVEEALAEMVNDEAITRLGSGNPVIRSEPAQPTSLSKEVEMCFDKVQDDELSVVKLLEGSAKHFDLPEDLVERLVRHGIAAKTEDGLMRGFKWNTFVK